MFLNVSRLRRRPTIEDEASPDPEPVQDDKSESLPSLSETQASPKPADAVS